MRLSRAWLRSFLLRSSGRFAGGHDSGRLPECVFSHGIARAWAEVFAME